MDTIAKDLEELKVRFDTAPKLYEKKDFQKLLHVIEHLSEGGIEKPDEPEKPEESAPSPVPEVKDHKQYKGDTSRAIAKIKKRKKIKFTEDGFAIADKAIGQKITVHDNEKIYINTPDWGWKYPIDVSGLEEQYYHHIIELIGEEIRDYGKFNNVYVHNKRTKYIDGKRQRKGCRGCQ